MSRSVLSPNDFVVFYYKFSWLSWVSHSIGLIRPTPFRSKLKTPLLLIIHILCHKVSIWNTSNSQNKYTSSHSSKNNRTMWAYKSKNEEEIDLLNHRSYFLTLVPLFSIKIAFIDFSGQERYVASGLMGLFDQIRLQLLYRSRISIRRWIHASFTIIRQCSHHWYVSSLAILRQKDE